MFSFHPYRAPMRNVHLTRRKEGKKVDKRTDGKEKIQRSKVKIADRLEALIQL